MRESIITLKFILLFILSSTAEAGNDKACKFPESEQHVFFFDVPNGLPRGSKILDSVVDPPDAELMLASVRSSNIEKTNFTHQFTLQSDGSGRFTIVNTKNLRLPPYPFPHEGTFLYMTVVCNEQAYPLITVRVMANNSHAPQFYHTPYVMRISEALAVGTELDTPILALDWDPRPDYDVRYTLENGTEWFSILPPQSVRSSGFLPENVLETWNSEQLPTVVRIRVDKQLDFDEGPREIYLKIAARDSAENVNFTTMVIGVNDVDDLLPQFSAKQYHGQLEKNHKVGSVLQVVPPLRAIDGDRGINRSIVYSLDPNSLDVFTIDQDTGEITVIDEGIQPPSTIVVRATQSDNEARFSSAVIGLGKETRPASFSACSFSVSLPENAPRGTHVVHLDVNHRTMNTQIRLNDPDGTFALDTDTVTVTVADNKILDREVFTTVELLIVLEDDSLPADPATCREARIHIELIDENDNSPQFDKELYTYEIDDATPNGKELVELKAIDQDEGENGRVSYELLMSSEDVPLELREVDDMAHLIYMADKDSGADAYHAVLQATDHGAHPRNKRVLIEIRRRGAPSLTKQTLKPLKTDKLLRDIQNLEPRQVASLLENQGRIEKKTDESDHKETDKISATSPSPESNLNSSAIGFSSTTETSLSTLSTSTSKEDVKLEEEDAPELTTKPETAPTVNHVGTSNDLESSEFPAPLETLGKNAVPVRESQQKLDVQVRPQQNISAGELPQQNLAAEVRPEQNLPVETRTRINFSLKDPIKPKLETAASKGPHLKPGSTMEQTTSQDVENDAVTLTNVVVDARNRSQMVGGEIDDDDATIEASNTVSQRPRVNSVTIMTTQEKGLTVPPTLITEEQITDFTERSREENVTSEEYDEQSTEAKHGPPPPSADDQFGFVDENYRFELYGDVQPGEVVGRVFAEPGAEMYGLDRRAVGLFKVDFDTGELSVDKHLQVQEPGIFRFTVSATNGMKTAETSVAIHYDPKRSVFETAPRFDQSKYTLHVTENQPAKVIAELKAYHRAVTLRQSNLVYSIKSDESDVPFSIEESSGQLAVLAELDREQRDRYEFRVQACLTTNPDNCGSANVIVNVNDLNDNDPKFPSNTYHIIIPGDLPKGSDVVQLVARDNDAGSNGVVSYAINPPSPNFAIDHSSGQVSILSPLTDVRYVIIVEAFDHGIPRRATHAELRITVEGSNPSAPQFDQQNYEVTLQAPVRAGSVVADVHARDPDPGEDGKISYRFAETEDQKVERDMRKFSINERTGAVSAVVPLTAFDGPYQFIVEAIDQSAVFSRKTQTMLTIKINGHSTLRFLPLPSTVYISSDKPAGSVVLRASAYTTGSSAVDFRLMEPSNEFAIDGDVLKVIAPLSQGETRLTLRAETDSNHVDHKLKIVVMSDRDKYPVFPHLAYDLEIPLESRFPLLLHKFEPRLANGTVKFTLFPPTHVPAGLRINENTGELTVTREYIDSRSNQDTVFIVVRATNIDYPKFYSDVGVSLTMVSTAASLRFPHSLYRISLPENMEVGTPLNVSIEIMPRVSTPQLTYSIVPNSFLGILHNGTLFVKESIDLETMPVDQQREMSFVVTAKDGDQSASTRLMITVEDENEFVPTFDYLHYRASVREDARPGDSLIKVHASDKDFTQGEKLIYTITGGSGRELVKVLSDGSVILGDVPLDRETKDHFDVVIEASDVGGNSAETRLDVTVTDVNDNAPEILNQPLIWNVSEGTDGLTESFQLLASDADSGDNAKVAFRIVNGDENGLFDLEQDTSVSASLHINKALDRETAAVHKITIEARDRGTPPLMSIATVTVNVKNINNKAPKFEVDELTQAVPGDLPLEFPIFTAAAVDPDGDHISYHLSGDGCEILKVDEKGVLTFATEVDQRPQVSTTIHCLLEASDGAHTASTKITMQLEVEEKRKPDGVNHPPKFAKDAEVFNVDLVREDVEEPGMPLGTVKASDPDDEFLHYSIEPVEMRDVFEINNKGRLSVRGPLSSLKQASYSFLVISEDNGRPPLSAYINVRVNVLVPKPEAAMVASSIKPAAASSVDSFPTTVPLPQSRPILTLTSSAERMPTTDHGVSNHRAHPSVFPTTQWTSTNSPENSETSIDHVASHRIISDSELFTDHPASIGPLPTTRSFTTFTSSAIDALAEELERTSTTPTWHTVEGGSEGVSLTTVVIETVGPKESEVTDFEEEVTVSNTHGGSSGSSEEQPFDTDGFSDLSPEPASIHTTWQSVETTKVPTTMISQEVVSELDSEFTTVVPGEFSFALPQYQAFMPEGRYSNGALLNLKPESLRTNGQNVVYQLEDPDHSLPFYIKETTGDLVIFDVDREMAPSYNFKITAVDRSSELNMRASTMVNVTILDVNDNYPLFISPPSVLGVTRNIEVNRPIQLFEAADADSDSNGRVTYTLQENQWFTVDWNSGVVSTKASLENAPESVELTITAKDSGRPPLRTPHQFTVRIFNGEVPKLPRADLKPTISHRTEPGTVVIDLLAGPTVDVKDKILYSLADNEFGLFKIDDSGRLLLNRVPNEKEQNRYHQLNVTAENSQGEDSVLVNVFIEGPPIVVTVPPKTVEENKRCTFPTRMYNTEVMENTEGRRKLVKVTSSCEQQGRNYSYVLWQGAKDNFEVDPITGDVFVTGPLDREQRSIHFLFINVTQPENDKTEKAKRQINPVIEHAKAKLSPWQTLVVVRVKDENDNIPKFIRLTAEGKYTSTIDWQAPLLAPVLKLQAQDNDEKVPLMYGAYGGDSDFFRVNSTTGLVQLVRSLQDGTKTEFHFTGTAADGVHVGEIPVSIYVLSPSINIVQLTADVPINEIDEQAVERTMNEVTNTDIRVLVKQPYLDEQGRVDAGKTHVFVYGLDSHTKVPIEKSKLRELLQMHLSSLRQSALRISSVKLPSVAAASLSFLDVLILVICLILFLIALVVCCLAGSYCKRRRHQDSEKGYMVDARPAGPRPYDVEAIPRVTAQSMSQRPLPDPMEFRENAEAAETESHSTNRSDEQLVFANSVRNYGVRAVPAQVYDEELGVHTLIADNNNKELRHPAYQKSNVKNKVFASETLSSTLDGDRR